jgi:hypothetical protein
MKLSHILTTNTKNQFWLSQVPFVVNKVNNFGIVVVVFHNYVLVVGLNFIFIQMKHVRLEKKMHLIKSIMNAGKFNKTTVRNRSADNVFDPKRHSA